MNDLSLIVLMV